MSSALALQGGELIVAPDGLTPQVALERIRVAKASGDTSAWTVHVKRGIHPLAGTLVLTPADSGSPSAPVTWIGEGEDSVIAGGAPLAGWREDGDGVWSAPIPKAPDGTPAYFEQLWVNGRRADRARIPNRCPSDLKSEYCRVKSPNSTAVTNSSTKAVSYVERCMVTNKEVVAALSTMPADEFPYAQMCVIHKWSTARRILRDFDVATGTVETWSPSPWVKWMNWSEDETIVCFENVRAGFDAPGEWFYDAKAGCVRYRPLPGEDMATACVMAPSSKISQLVAVKGDPDRGEYVHDIVFRNLSFACSDATPTSVQKDAIVAELPSLKLPSFSGFATESWQCQAACGSDGAVTLEGARNLVFTNCTFRHTGNYALRFDDGCTSNAVECCLMEDLGAGGVWMGSRRGQVVEGEQLTRRVIRNLAPRSTAFNRIENCIIRNGGRFNPEGTGIALTHASDSKVLNCDIHDMYYTGVSVGFTWGFSGSVAQRNEIAFNRIYDLGKGVMSDMGGVYTLGTSFGTTVHDNVVHDVKSYSYGGWALYCDEGSEGIVMERNLCWNTTDGGFHQHYGTGCVIRNNIFAWNHTLGAVRIYRQEVQQIPCSLHFVNNIVLVREGPLVGSGARGVGGVWANNVWYDVSGKPELDGLDWTQWSASGKETGSVYADPGFVDAEHFDFRLKPDSPAFARGFKVWDFAAP